MEILVLPSDHSIIEIMYIIILLNKMKLSSPWLMINNNFTKIKNVLSEEKENALKEIEQKYKRLIEQLPEELHNTPAGLLMDRLRYYST